MKMQETTLKSCIGYERLHKLFDVVVVASLGTNFFWSWLSFYSFGSRF